MRCGSPEKAAARRPSPLPIRRARGLSRPGTSQGATVREVPVSQLQLPLGSHMAGILAACARLHFVPANGGRCLRNVVSLPWRKEDLGCLRPFAVFSALQPCSWWAPGIWVGQPRGLGVWAPSRRVPEKQSSAESLEPLRLIYRFPGIRICRLLSRLKLLQTGLTFLIVPPVWYLYWQSQTSQTQCLYITGIACFAAAMLYGMSFYLRRIIGMMYLNDSGSLLKVSHLTFWGGRRDIYCPVETVMTLGDVGECGNDLLLQFKQHDRDHFLYFSLRLGQIVDPAGFAKVFGGVQ
ncbi:transmembrane protein 186 [Elgaria multicarinata webbii]|uniref:transmembrane protein 186 n=1 Tax=Elgaria multicarinata webbii TaxID=159646 RepID=UPI002FCCB8B6